MCPPCVISTYYSMCGFACISQNPPKVLRGTELFGGQGGQMAVAGRGLLGVHRQGSL